MAFMKLKRELRTEALAQLEKSARSQEDFEKLVKEYNKIDRLRERRERRNEICNSKPNYCRNYLKDDERYDSRTFEMIELKDHAAVIPATWKHDWWRQLQSGNFLDFIYDCPFEISELTSHRVISRLIGNLKDEQKEVFYYRVIKRYSVRKISEIRGQTDRNIRRLYGKIIEDLQGEYFSIIEKIHIKEKERKRAEANQVPLIEIREALIEMMLAVEGVLFDRNFKVRKKPKYIYGWWEV